ncbi:MAG TPA: histidine ammonia-lyase [Bacteroidetes bacterium]|nr:histidine ammonia-lyase [Bacteroidota bacterium]
MKKPSVHVISPGEIGFDTIQTILNPDTKLELSDECRKRINRCRKYLDERIERSSEPLYGITTGFGSLCDRSISRAELGTLQENLVKSHACGTGPEVPSELVRLMLFLKIQSLAYGNSGVQTATVQRLTDFFNHDIIPVVYQYGSLGASGDLAPLAHLSLPLIGLGEVYAEGRKVSSREVLKKMGWQPVELQSKEGLALLNGTQFMSAYGAYLTLHVSRLSLLADVIGALSLDVYDGRIEPFHSLVQEIRPHGGQIETARRIRWLLEGSELIARKGKAVQDPYSFRCIPQVHGASKDSILYVASVFRNEINSVTDNPTIFPDEDLIISAGNFHGQPLALALDNLCIAMAELGNISERRIYQLLSGKRGLPPFLVANPGLNSGFMIPQYTAAAMVSHNKQLATPASVDSIETSQGQEDHVSMGATAALKAYQIMENLERILAIELYNAAQALDFRRPLKTSPWLENFVAEYRRQVHFVENDKTMYQDIFRSVEFLRNVKMSLPDE